MCDKKETETYTDDLEMMTGNLTNLNIKIMRIMWNLSISTIFNTCTDAGLSTHGRK